MPKISVIIPTYNRAHLLNMAVQSALNQTFRDIEIIIVDDASTDDTGQLVKTFNDKRLLYFRHEKNMQGSAARNTGIKHASSEYIAFLDSDDEWLPNKLERQMELFNSRPKTLGLVYSAFIKENWKTQHDAARCRGDVSTLILVENFVGTTSTVLARKECFTKAGLFDQTLPSCQDWDMWIRIAQFYTFDFLDETLIRYYHQVSSISMNSQAVIEGHKLIEEKYIDKIKKLPGNLLAKHYFNLGKTFFYKRDIINCLIYFINSGFTSFSIMPNIIDFLVMRTVKKLLNKIK